MQLRGHKQGVARQTAARLSEWGTVSQCSISEPSISRFLRAFYECVIRCALVMHSTVLRCTQVILNEPEPPTATRLVPNCRCVLEPSAQVAELDGIAMGYAGRVYAKVG